VGKSKSQSNLRGRIRMILIPGGRAEPTEVGGLRQVVSELTIFFLFLAWNILKQFRQEGGGDKCSIQLWKGKCENSVLD
jgi:hypothetical protein